MRLHPTCSKSIPQSTARRKKSFKKKKSSERHPWHPKHLLREPDDQNDSCIKPGTVGAIPRITDVIVPTSGVTMASSTLDMPQDGTGSHFGNHRILAFAWLPAGWLFRLFPFWFLWS